MIVFMSIFFLLSGCSSVRMSVTGYRNQTGALSPGQSVYVATNPGAENPLLEREVAQKISSALQAKGYRLASLEEADLILAFGYGRGLGKVDSVTFGGGIEIIPITNPYTGVIEYKNIEKPGHTEVYQNYMRSLSIKVLDAGKLRLGKQEPIWTCDVVSEGRSNDLRSTLNYLIAGAFQYFGQDTGKAVKIKMDASSGEREGGMFPLLKGGLLPNLIQGNQ
ncbi:MAG: DUF4136 domain-containing protein [Syntrophobacteraceae bacterium]